MAQFTYDGDLEEATKWRSFGESMVFKLERIANGGIMRMNHQPTESVMIMAQCNPHCVYINAGGAIDVVVRSDTNVYIIRERVPAPGDTDQTRLRVVQFPLGKGVGFAFSWTDYKNLACSVFEAGYTSLLVKGVEYPMPVDTNDYRVVGVSLVNDTEGFYVVLGTAVLNLYALREIKLYHFTLGKTEAEEPVFTSSSLIWSGTADPFIGLVMTKIEGVATASTQLWNATTRVVIIKDFDANGGTTLGGISLLISQYNSSWSVEETILQEVGLQTTSETSSAETNYTYSSEPYFSGGPSYSRTVVASSSLWSFSESGLSIPRCSITDTFGSQPLYPAINLTSSGSKTMTYSSDAYVGQVTADYQQTDSINKSGSVGVVYPLTGGFVADGISPYSYNFSFTTDSSSVPDLDPTENPSISGYILCMGTTSGSANSAITFNLVYSGFIFADPQVRVVDVMQRLENATYSATMYTQAVPGGCPVTQTSAQTITGGITETRHYRVFVNNTEVYTDQYYTHSWSPSSSYIARFEPSPIPSTYPSQNYTYTDSPGASILPAMGSLYVTNGKLYVVKVGTKLVVLKVSNKTVKPEVLGLISAENPNTLKMALHKH